MERNNETGLIPPNRSGKAITAEATHKFGSADAARMFYETAKQRMLDVNQWKDLGGTATFQLTDNIGNEVDRGVRKGDHFRIDIPGPGTVAGDGYDWAYVEDVEEVTNGDVQSVAVLVRPAENPLSNDSNTAHFFSKQSTSSFVITRQGNTVSAGIYDRNIEPNTETESLVDKARNALVGLGAKHGMSKVQWQSLVDAFVKPNAT